MKAIPAFGMAFRFAHGIARADAAALLRMVRRRNRPLMLAPGSYFFDGLTLRTREP